MIYFLILILAGYLIFQAAAGKRYEEILMNASKSDYPLKQLLPGALLLTDLLGIKHFFDGNKKSCIMVRLYGREQTAVQLRIFNANRLLYMVICALPALFSGAASGAADMEIAVFWAVLSVLAAFMTERELGKRLEKRMRAIQLELPDFINKLALLINAGLTLRRAWQKISADASGSGPLHIELDIAAGELALGRSELTAYENFAKRCGIPEVTRLITVIVQNLKRGSSDMVSVLRISANECWQVRKNAARRLGEEASTKMLLPLILMFIAVLIIVAAPAVISMGLF